MLNELLALDLLVMTLLLAHVSYNCFRWNRDKPALFEQVDYKSNELLEMITEGGNLLADIADLLSEGQPQSAPNSAGKMEVVPMLMQALMANMNMGINDGPQTSKEQRTIYEGEEPETPESTD